jgi:hypothetical protein
LLVLVKMIPIQLRAVLLPWRSWIRRGVTSAEGLYRMKLTVG